MLLVCVLISSVERQAEERVGICMCGRVGWAVRNGDYQKPRGAIYGRLYNKLK